jgi:hypothetical protein
MRGCDDEVFFLLRGDVARAFGVSAAAALLFAGVADDTTPSSTTRCNSFDPDDGDAASDAIVGVTSTDATGAVRLPSFSPPSNGLHINITQRHHII